MKKVFVQFDGSNFYNKVKRVLPHVHLTTFQYAGLAESLAQMKPIKVTYYTGKVRQYTGNRKSELLFNNQQSLFSNLRQQNIEIKTGYLLLSNGNYHEKGVDVHIAADMIYGALKDEYDSFYLISSDTDLIPAIDMARAEKKDVVYVGFEHFMSRGLVKNCSSYRILKKSDILKFAKN